jgi:ADP-heptose:LPS heptosyltransferase
LRSSAALIYANGIGDHLVTLPTVRALSAHFGARLRLISFAEAKEWHYLGVRFSAFHPTIFRDEAAGEKSFDPDAAAGLVGSCPLVISLNPWHSPWMDRFLALVRPAFTVGFNPGFDVQLPLDYDRHCADMTFEMARVFDSRLNVETFAAPPRLKPAIRKSVRRLMRTLPRKCRVLAVHADTQPWKEWKRDYFKAALHGFLEQRPEFIAFIVGQRDTDLEHGRHADRVVSCRGHHLHVALAIVEQADLFLGVDSFALHMADLTHTPGVGLFGATSAVEWGFRFAPHVHVDCGKAMDRNTVDEVIGALEQLAREPQTRIPAARRVPATEPLPAKALKRDARQLEQREIQLHLNRKAGDLGGASSAEK